MQNYLIWGMGKSGTASLELLRKSNNIFLYDDNNMVYKKLIFYYENEKNIHIIDKLNYSLIKQMDCIVISPGISIYNVFLKYAKRNKIPVISELELAYTNTKKELIAITGTNGKTTTTQLIYNILSLAKQKVSKSGNIGNPLSEEIKLHKNIKSFICEVSSFQLEAVKSFKPHIALLLNISHDHIDRHKTFSNYSKTKYKIFKNLTKKDFCIINSKLSLPKTSAKIYEFGFNKVERGCYIGGGNFIYVDNGKSEVICSTHLVNLIGKHNLENVMASIIVAKIKRVSNKVILKALENSKLDNHRIELVYQKNGNCFYDDSKATNLDSTLVATQALNFHKGIRLILGGSDKGYSFTELLKKLPTNITKLYITGSVSNRIVKDLIGLQNKRLFNYTVFKTLKEAVQSACFEIESGEILLLSPACASFDEFKNYKERGDKFLQYIKGYYEKES